MFEEIQSIMKTEASILKKEATKIIKPIIFAPNFNCSWSSTFTLYFFNNLIVAIYGRIVNQLIIYIVFNLGHDILESSYLDPSLIFAVLTS